MMVAFLCGLFLAIGMTVVTLISCIAWASKRFDDDLL
jgi:hypothetical protein